MTATADISSAKADVFCYGDFDIDPRKGALNCTYFVGGSRFEERFVIEGGGSWHGAGVEEAAQLVFLLAGVSYYKAFAPPVVDLGSLEVTPGLRAFLHDFYIHGLGEFAYRNDLDLNRLEIVGGRDRRRETFGSGCASQIARPLVPFGGGMDSLVSVEIVRRSTPDTALFVVSRAGDRFKAIETAAKITGLPVLRATRELDPAILRSRELGFLNGHVPVTGILSAIAVLAALLSDRDAVIMSNEWSASVGNVERDGQMINHQYSKSASFEYSFREVVRELASRSPNYFSLLRPYTELAIAQKFAGHPEYLNVFRSCNRAFHIDPEQRLDRWCGRCDKCIFIDLILSPFLSPSALKDVFRGHEPLDNPDLIDAFRTLIGVTPDTKPFECVGDVSECRGAVLLAGSRPNRRGSPVLTTLWDELRSKALFDAVNLEQLLSPAGEHFIPEPYAAELRLA